MRQIFHSFGTRVILTGKGVLRAVWHIIELVLHKYYPPRRYAFFPLYRRLRHRYHLPMWVSNFLVWLTSAVLHGMLLAFSGRPEPVIIVMSVLVFLGVVSSVYVMLYK